MSVATIEQPASDARPTAPAVQFDPIPKVLTSRAQWCNWRYEYDGKRWTKVPYQPNGFKAESDDATTWCAFADVREAYLANLNGDEHFDGVGFIFSAADPFCGIDLDDCINAAGQLCEGAASIVADMDTYCEISPSNEGLKLWAVGDLPTPKTGTRRAAPGWEGEVEMYHRTRYFAVTGNVWPGTRATIEDRREKLHALFRTITGGNGHDENGHLPESIIESGLRFCPAAQPPVRKLEAALAWIDGFREVWDRRRKFRSTSEYCGSITMLLLDNGWSQQEVLDAWTMFRRRFGELPGSGKEALRKARHDIKTALAKIESRKAQNVNDHATDDGSTSKPADQPKQPPAESKPDASGASPDKLSYQWLTFAELMAGDFRQNYLVDDIVTEAQGGIISGRFKTLKTTVAVDLFVSMAAGVPFLGRFKVAQPVPCGMMSAESGLATIQDVCRRVVKAKGLDGGSITNLHLSPSCPRLAQLDHLDAIERTIVERGLRCLAVDPTYLAFCDVGDSSSNVFKMGMVLEGLTRLIEKTRCTIILLNHNRKGRGQDVGKFDPPELAEISMSGFAEWMRFWLLLGPRQEWDEQTGRHWLWMRTGGSAGHAGLWGLDATEGRRSDEGGRRWEVTVDVGHEVRRAEKEQLESRKEAQKQLKAMEAKHAIVTFLIKRKGEPATKTAIRDAVGMSNQSFTPVFTQLLSDGEIYPAGKVKIGNGQHVDGYARAGGSVEK